LLDERLEHIKGVTIAVNQKTSKTKTKRKGTKRLKKMILKKTLHRTLKTEKQKPNKIPG